MNFIKLKCLVYCLTFMFSDIDLNGITNMFSYIIEVRAVFFYYTFLFSIIYYTFMFSSVICLISK